MWFKYLKAQYVAVFPTPVGVFPSIVRFIFVWWSLPHARGGVSLKDTGTEARKKSSPRPWGCFPVDVVHVDGSCVFPTPVGVFPKGSGRAPLKCSLPHARGGVSNTLAVSGINPGSSPRPWGCFPSVSRPDFAKKVFPTPVGVFLKD